jgi:hypothetical protein
VLCRSENGVFISGTPDSPIEDVLLDNVRVEVNKTSKWPGGRYDRRPPEDDEHLYPHTTAGVFIEQAKDIALRNVSVAWGENRPDTYGPALECHNVTGLDLQAFRGEAAHPDRGPAQILD